MDGAYTRCRKIRRAVLQRCGMVRISVGARGDLVLTVYTVNNMQRDFGGLND